MPPCESGRERRIELCKSNQLQQQLCVTDNRCIHPICSLRPHVVATDLVVCVTDNRRIHPVCSFRPHVVATDLGLCVTGAALCL